MTDEENLSPISEPPLSWKTKLTTRIQAVRQHLRDHMNRESFLKTLKTFDPQKSIDLITTQLQKRGVNFYGTLLTLTVSTYFTADLTALIAEKWIPEPSAGRNSRTSLMAPRPKTMDSIAIIGKRNLFNSQGLMPGEDNPGTDPGGAPVKSSLPLNLIGILLLENEARSIATIEDKQASSIFPLSVGDEIPSKLTVLKIESRRVIFVNKNSNRREYLELPEEPHMMTSNRITTASGPTVEKVAATQYSVSRSEVDKALSDLNNILTQARAVPNFENGVTNGYKLFQIVPNSIYDKLGLQNGDVISGLNGQPINDPAKAFELLSELKTSSHLELQVKKNGKSLTYTYDIH